MDEKRKKIFLIWSGEQKEGKKVILSLKEKGYDTLYWLGTDEDRIRIPGTVFHDRLMARQGVPAEGHTILEFPPPSASSLRNLYKTESIIMTMMNRKEARDLCVDEKKRLYYELVRYWQGIIFRYKPDIMVFSAFPHNLSNIVIYYLAKVSGIKIIMIHETWASDRLLIQHDYEESSLSLKQAFARNMGKKFKPEDLSPDLQAYYRKQTDPAYDATPMDYIMLKRRFSGLERFVERMRAFISGVKNLSIFKRAIRYIKRKFGDNLEKEYNRFVSPVDYSQKYVYVALHWQPEGSTSPLGDMFVDQILMLEILSYSVPPNWTIYVKEHPFQWKITNNPSFTNMKYKGYYERIARLPKVSLVPIETDTHKLTESAKAIATVTGRVALEGVFAGKPSIVFGYPWFMDMPGIFRVEDTLSAAEVFHKIENGFRIDKQLTINYLKSLDESSARGYLDLFADKNTNLSKGESTGNIIKLLVRELNGLK